MLTNLTITRGNRNFKPGETTNILPTTSKDKYDIHLPAEISQQDECGQLSSQTNMSNSSITQELANLIRQQVTDRQNVELESQTYSQTANNISQTASNISQTEGNSQTDRSSLTAPDLAQLSLTCQKAGDTTNQISESMKSSELSCNLKTSLKLYISTKRKSEWLDNIGPAQPGTSGPVKHLRQDDWPN